MNGKIMFSIALFACFRKKRSYRENYNSCYVTKWIIIFLSQTELDKKNSVKSFVF